MTNANDLAYPHLHQNSDGSIQYDVNTGLTKREYFAAIAMQGLFAGLYSDPNLTGWSSGDIAKESVKVADELIKALNEAQ